MPEGLGPSAVSSISDRLAVTAAACDAVSARYAELVRGELDALPLDRAVLAALTGEAGSPRSAGCHASRATARPELRALAATS